MLTQVLFPLHGGGLVVGSGQESQPPSCSEKAQLVIRAFRAVENCRLHHRNIVFEGKGEERLGTGGKLYVRNIKRVPFLNSHTWKKI